MVAVSVGAIVSTVVGSTVTSQFVGGLAVRATPVIGAVPVLVMSKVWVVGPPASRSADRTSLGVDSVIE